MSPTLASIGWPARAIGGAFSAGVSRPVSVSRDPEGTPLTYQWRLLSGPVATALDDDQIVQPRATLP
ncbi:MAG: hypothetical protein AAFV53_28155, partial [Myxococcota bacterium]